MDRQYISSCLHKQNGRYTFEKFHEFTNRPVGMVLPKSLDSVSPASPRAFQCESRQGLEIEPRHFPDITKLVGLVRGRPFCIPTNKTMVQICQLEVGPNGSLHGCLLTGLGANTRVFFSPICFNRPLRTTVEVSESRSVRSGSTSVADSTLVPLTTAIVSRTSTTVPNVSTTANEGQSIASTRQHPFSWVEAVGQHYKTTDLSSETRNVLLAAWRQNTRSAYASAWRKWV